MKKNFFLTPSLINTEISKEIFLVRANKFFEQTLINAALHAVAAILYSYLLYLFNTDNSNIINVFVMLNISFLLMLLLNYFYKRHPLAPVIIKKLLLLRVAVSSMIALIYSFSIFILPSDISAFNLLVILIVITIIDLSITLSQISFPEFYLSFKVIIITSSLFYLFTHLNPDNLIITAISIFYILTMTPRLIYLSLIAIDDVEVRVKLKHEMIEHIRLKEENKYLSLHDELTRLPNRRHIEETAKLLISSSLRSNKLIGFIFIDLNKFKIINDDFGHDIGDCLLQAVANTLTTTLRKSDVAGRLGGDEFCVIAQNIKTEDDLKNLTKNIKNSLSQHVVCHHLTIKSSASVGSACFPYDGDDFSKLLKVADQRMYQDKKVRLRQASQPESLLL